MNKHESFWDDLRAASFEQGYVNAGGIKTRYLHAGETDKPPLVLLHGVGGHAETYTRNLEAHAAHFNTYSIDLVGHGYSDKPDYDYEVDNYVEHVRAFIDTLGFDTIYLSGESLGGWVSARFALKYPERLQRMVLNTCGGATLNPEVMQRIKTLTMAAVSDPTWETVKARLEWLMADPATVTDDLIACRQAIYRQAGMVDAMSRIMCLQETETRRRNNLTDEDWAAIEVETLVLWTDKDPTAAVNVGEKIAKLIPNARFVCMKNCGHWPQFEDPSTFNQLHLDFLLGRA